MGAAWIPAIIAGILGGVLGALLATMMRSEPLQVAQVGGVEPLQRDIQTLTRELRDTAARASLPQPEPVGAAPSAVEPLAPRPTADLTPVIERLDALVARFEAAGERLERPFEIPDQAVTEPARQALFDASGGLPDELFLMTYQQVLERYGRPSDILLALPGSAEWVYVDRVDSKRRRTFTFADGFLKSWRKN